MKAIRQKIMSIRKNDVGEVVIGLEDGASLVISHTIYEDPRVVYKKCEDKDLIRLSDKEYREERV